MSVNKWRLWAPKASALSHPTDHSLFSFYLFLSFFLSSLLFFLSLFFFICSSFCFSSEQKAHTHRPLTRTAFFCFLSIQCSFFFVLFVLLPPVTHMPTQAERSSASIFDHTQKSSTTHSFSSSLLSYLFFNLAGASKSAFTATANLRWKQLETIRSESSVVNIGNNSVGSSFFIWKLFFFFFFSWCTINKYEWSFEFGVMSCFRWC